MAKKKERYNDLFESEDERTAFLVKLRLLGATKAIVSYSGSGDSGQIDEVTLLDVAGASIDIRNEQYDYADRESVWDGKKFKVVVKPKTLTPLEDILINMVYTATDEYNWANNDGGQGTLTIDLTASPPTIMLEHEQNITEVERYDMEF